jgi:hypothetical protein
MDNNVKQTMKVRITRPDRQDRLTIYSKMNRDEEFAIMEGVGTLGSHVFTLKITGNTYELTDRINNKSFSGNIEEFDMIPLNKELIFTRLDINQPQPIMIRDEKKRVEVEITITKQEAEAEQ